MTSFDSLMPPRPTTGRVFTASRRVRLSDMDARGRLRLDAVARYLQDVAGDDVDETGWGAPEHVWVVRRTRVDVVEPIVGDVRVELATWCSAMAGTAAGRRTSVVGGGGRIETDSVWVHLDAAGRPSRLDPSFGVYGETARGRRVSTRLALPNPPAGAAGTPFPLRVADVDVLGHVNNAVYWAAVEDVFQAEPRDPRVRAFLEFRRPIDLGERVELVTAAVEPGFTVALVVDRSARAVCLVETR